MYDRVVVPLDGSRLAEVALPYAEELAAKMDCELILLTVLESEEASEYEKHYSYAKKIAEVTKRHAGKYNGNGGDKTAEVGTATRTGNPAEAIIEYASKGGFPLIVMASHGRSGLNRWAVGSVADKVVRGTTCQPVMLIRAKESRSDIREKRILKRALVPLDGSARSRAVIPYIAEIASRLEMELTLLQAVPPNNHTRTDVEAYLQMECHALEDKGITARYEVSAGEAADKIIDLADELAFDLVAMSTHGKTGAVPWSLGSVAQKVFLGGNTPLLLVRE